MNKFIRLASMTALLATTAFVTGCECQDGGTDEEGRSITTCESLQKFVGTTRTDSVAYTDGYALNFDGVNGNVDVVVGNGTDVQVEFSPYSLRGNSKEAEAKLDIENDLITTINNDGAINIDVSRASGANSGLGADVTITLPAGFNGAVNLEPNNGFVDVDLDGVTPTSVTIDLDESGNITVQGARGPLNIKGGFDIDVRVAEWGPEGANGSIISDGQLGDVTVSLPIASAGSIQAVAEDGTVSGPVPLPATWDEQIAAENSKTYTFGVAAVGEPGAQVQVQAGENIVIDAL